MSNKRWPKDGTPTTFDKITIPLRKAFRDLYKLTRKADSCKWTGLDIGARELACCLSPSKKLTKAQLDYDKDHQGRDPLDVLIGIAIQLGIEQGRRCAYAEDEMLFSMRRILTQKVAAREDKIDE